MKQRFIWSVHRVLAPSASGPGSVSFAVPSSMPPYFSTGKSTFHLEKELTSLSERLRLLAEMLKEIREETDDRGSGKAQ